MVYAVVLFYDGGEHYECFFAKKKRAEERAYAYIHENGYDDAYVVKLNDPERRPILNGMPFDHAFWVPGRGEQLLHATGYETFNSDATWADWDNPYYWRDEYADDDGNVYS